MDKIKQLKEKLLSMDAFDLNTFEEDYLGNILVKVFPNFAVVKPLTSEAELELRSKPYNRLLKSKKHCFVLYYFPKNIHVKAERMANMPTFPIKYQTRLRNITEAYDLGNIELSRYITLPLNEFLQLEFIKKPYKKGQTDYHDDEIDTLCTKLKIPPKKYIELPRVSLTYHTSLILRNAKIQKNKSLLYYLDEGGTKVFYRDCIINYILEHSRLLNPDTFKYINAPTEVHIKAKDLRKLYPHRTFKLDAPEGVTIKYDSPKNAKRLRKNDIVIFNFSMDFLNKYRAIIRKDESNADKPNSFIKVPMFFVLHALHNDNLTSGGFSFLLWFLSFFRMKNPKIFHSLNTILKETGADIKHGYKKPIATLNKYFDYLFKVNAFENIEEPIKFTVKDIDNTPRFNGALLRIKKPKL